MTRNWTWIELHKEKPDYVLTPWERTAVEQQFGLKEIYRRPVSGSAPATSQLQVAGR